MICELIRQGKKVGVTAGSHKVIRNLLDAVGKAGGKVGLAVKLGHRKTAQDDDDDDEGSVATFDSNEAAIDALTSAKRMLLAARHGSGRVRILSKPWTFCL